MGILDSIGTFLGDEENRLNLASGFAGMSGNPNAGNIQQGYQNRLTALRGDRKLASAKELEASKLENDIKRALQLLGEFPDIANAVRGGFLSPNAGVTEARKRKAAGPKSQGAIIDQFNLAKSQGFAGGILDFKQAIAKSGASSVSVDARTGSEVGTIPQGYELFTTPEGGRSLRPLAGGPAAAKVASLEDKAASAQGTTARTSSIVLEDIGRLKSLISGQEMLTPVTGISGSVASMIPSSARVDAETLAMTIKGNIGFDRLQQMRNDSPTGGALGAINAQEMTLLSSVLGSLDLSQSEDQLLVNLNRLEQIYDVIMRKAQAYPNAGNFGVAPPIPQSDNVPTWNSVKGVFE